MPNQTRVVSPGPRPETVLTATKEILAPPADWSLLLPGDPGLTRRVKAAGPSWTVQEKRGRKTFSQGVWDQEIFHFTFLSTNTCFNSNCGA